MRGHRNIDRARPGPTIVRGYPCQNYHTLIGGVLIAAALIGAQPGFAQTTTAASATMPAPYGLFLTTPHPEVKVPPGKPVSFPLKLTNDTERPARLDLALAGLPDGWTYTLKGGEYEVAAAMIARGGQRNADPDADAARRRRAERLPARSDRQLCRRQDRPAD